MLKLAMQWNEKKEYVIALILLIVILITSFFGVVFQGKTLTVSSFGAGTTATGPYLYKERVRSPVHDAGASIWHWEPAMQLNNLAYNNKTLPLWNPYNGAGQPLAADMQSSSFFPLALPILLNASQLMWDLFLLLRLLIAGFCTFLFLRLIKIKPIPAFSSAIIFMLSSYFLVFINMAHLNVETLIPLMFLAVELLVQRKNAWSAIVLAISTALVILGGMPESTALVFVITTLYFIYRVFQQLKTDNNILQTILLFSTGLLIGFSLSAVSWLPFLEYSKLFWSNHDSSNLLGIVSLPPFLVLQFLAPGSLGLIFLTHVGLLPLFLSVVGKKNHPAKWFFIILAIVIGLKIFGIGINWIGYLPILKRVWLYKYSQPYLAFAIAILTAMVLDNQLRARLWLVLPLTALWAGALFYFRSIAHIFLTKEIPAMTYKSINMKQAIVFLLIAFLLTVLPKLFKRLKLNYLVVLASTLILLELWLNIPAERARRHNPYIAPPFVKFLQKQQEPFRIYAISRILWPNTNSVYKIQDVRSFNAVQPENYMKYLSLFSDVRKKGHITGLEGANLDSQFFDALNIRYVLATEPLQKNIDYWLKKQNLSIINHNGEPYFKAPFEAEFIFPKDVESLIFRAQSPSNQELLVHSIGSSQQITSKLALREGKNKLSLDIAQFSGKTIQLKFSSQDQLLLNAFHFSKGGDLSTKFRPVFIDKTVKPAVTIYQNKQELPRVMLYDQVSYADKNSLNELLKINIRKQALVAEPIGLGPSAKKLKYSAQITSYKPQEIRIKVRTNKEALLVLADIYYPGWKVYVNGLEKKIIKANYLFRGVKVGPGTKEVVFVYDANVYKFSFGFLGFAMLAMVGIVISGIRNIQAPNNK